MVRIRKLKITTTYRRTLRFQPPLLARCPTCRRQVEALATAEAAAVLAVDETVVGDLIAAGEIHAIYTVSGHFHICKDSLFAPDPEI